MMTRQPSFPPPELKIVAPVVIAHLALEVVTPMFGGGATPGYSDDDWPIRSAAIRGQLRFWWRACNARRFASVAAMRDEESRLWGSSRDESKPTSGPGAIELSVKMTNCGTVEPNVDGPGAAVFPFKETGGENAQPERPGRKDIHFELCLTLTPNSKVSQQNATRAVEQALWAWIMFGGVGARTRRGCGSLKCTGDAASGGPLQANAFKPPAQQTTTWLQQQAARLIENDPALTPPDDLKLAPVLHGATLITGAKETDKTTAWHDVNEPLRKFRQEKEIGRNKGGIKKDKYGKDREIPGQSRWPEPGAIRGIFPRNRPGLDREGHQYKRVPGANGDYFPRADLGLPIVFHMEGDLGGASEFSETLQLAQQNRARMASPLIVKPLALANGKCVALTLLLTAPHLWDPLVPGLEFKATTYQFTAAPMTATTWPWKEPPNVAGQASARDAYVAYVVALGGCTRITL